MAGGTSRIDPFVVEEKGSLVEPHRIPITEELDLHHFRPSEIGSLIPAYLEEAHGKGFRSVRLIHGKGTGALREGVHALLKKHPAVVSYGLCGETDGSWGATRVWMKEDVNWKAI